MSDWLIALEGTEAGHRAALMLALTAAFLHAVFGALQKGRHDPWVSRVAIDVWLVTLSLPLIFLVPWPEPHMWPIFAGMVLIHFGYKLLQAMAYTRGAYTVVYPVVRGTGPLFAVIGAWLIFGETFNVVQWLGLGVLLAGIFGLAVYNLIFLETARDTLGPALAYAVATGLFVALYTTYDAYGIRATADPFTFLAWFFFLSALDFPLMMALTPLRHRMRDLEMRPLLTRGLIGAVVAFGSFGSVMMATRLDKVGEAAVLRETSTVFAAVIGWLVLRETVGPRRIALMALIAIGAVIVEIGG
ncbi:DMT family transporter [Mameliella alba]|nr:DMT family transporter [Antarctobacter heliothermus]MBY6145371.1 DMT family transporter [Mameliella alba]MBY6162181.1 DMT family transporter [Mameliella alba]MBY6170651.1 DMT family transporter [Mameliella alba]MBY6175669.1 DMT family transporter [Mameliella alba]